MASRIRALDWSATPLGAIGDWPQSLKTATALLVASPIPMAMLWGEQGVMIYNDGYSIIAGERHPELLGSNVREGWPEVADFNDNVMKVGLGGGTLAYRDQVLTLHRSGSPEQVWMNLDYWPVPGEDGRPAGVIATVVETTERVLADRQKDEAGQRLDMALSAGGGVGTWDWDVPADRIQADARFAHIYGVDPEKARKGAPIAEFFGAMHPEDAERVQAEIAHALASGEPFASEYRLEQPDGDVRWVAAQGRAALSSEGQPLRFPGVTFDITDRRRMSDALAESRQELQRLTDNLPLLVAFVGADLRYQFANAAYLQWFGVEPEELRGTAVVDLIGEEAFALLKPRLDRALAGERVSSEQYVPYAKGGARHTRTELIPRRDASGAVDGYYAMIEDITDRKQAELRQAALIELSDALRDQTDAAEIAHTSARILAKALNVTRAGYGVMDLDAETITIDRDYNAPEVTSIAGVLQFRDFGSYIEDLKRGETVAIADAATDPRTRDTADALAGIGVASFVNMPLMEQGRVVALVFVNHVGPRAWSEGDIDLIREVAERVRASAERARATADLRESEARFRNMADNTPMMMWVTDPSGWCTYLNRTWYEFTGQTVGEAEGYGWLDATHPDDKARAEETFVTANAARAPFQVEYRLRRADGTYRWAIDAASPRFDANGEYLGYVGSVIDIDERREMEDALRASETELRMLNADLEQRVIERTMARGRTWQVSPELFAVADDNGQFVESNPAWGKVFGWSPDEMAATPFIELVHPDDVEPTLAVYADLKRGVPLLRFENRYRAKNGDYRWLSWIAVPDEGKLYCSARDITADKQAKAERDRLWRNTRDIQVVIDADGVFQAVNPAFTTLLGWSTEDVIEKTVFNFVVPDEAATMVALETARGAPLPTFENQYRCKDGDARWISWVAAPDDGLIYASGRDITDQKAQAAELIKAHEALRQSQKMEAVGQLTGGIAHDFNNLLAGISGSLELMQKRMAEGRLTGIDRYINAAQESSRRAASLTQRLLAFSRRQTLDPKPTDVNRLIAGMEELVRRTVGPDVEVEVVGAGGLWATRIDPSQLENALLNLCINARDAMAPDGGRLTIETANKWLDDRASRERDLSPGQYVSLCVTDTGSGMTPEVIDKAFDPFFTTKPIGQGTGLGLSMIHGFVRQSGGQVRIYSEVGKGTTMCLYLPRFMGEADGDDVFEQAIAGHVGHGETVLVIDDEPTVRMLIVEVLQDTGYNVLEAEDGPSGLRILQSDVRVDLLVTDVGLPGGMNGRQVADAARVSRPDLKILFVTGYAENAAVGNGHLDAGMAVITKPFEVAGLGNKVREMIEG